MSQAPVTVIETEYFLAHVGKFFPDDDEKKEFIYDLAKNPLKGKVIAGTGGIRKLRYSLPQKNKGKRGGARVIYFYYNDRFPLSLLAIFGKNEQENLTVGQKKSMSDWVKAITQGYRRKS